MYIHYFNPRSREGSDSSLSMTFNTLEISIHAPVKGATYIINTYNTSTHYFNPRSREGSDQRVDGGDSGIMSFQSTLPRRERHKEITGEDYNKYFNPRSREGSDAERDR